MTDQTIPVRVALRIRPLSDKEVKEGCQACLDVVPGRHQVYLLHESKLSFTYDVAYGPDATQEGIYDSSVRPLVNQLFKGYNATILAYGQTGSGKTFSMGTASSSTMPASQMGIIPRAIRDIFRRIEDMQDYTFSVRITFVELYKEQLFDLLAGADRRKDECGVDIREDPKQGVIIANLSEVSVDNPDSALQQLEVGAHKRVTAATAMNNISSRSHAIFSVLINGSRHDLVEASDDGGLPSSIMAKFHLVDLAGSERAKKTQATGERYKEGVAINLGLLALGNVISALGEEGGKARSHIPYRDSKLTRLLQDSLGGNSYTLMIACVSPADSNLEESISTLRYADRARKIKNKPIINLDEKDEVIARLRRENLELRARLGDADTGDKSEDIKYKLMYEKLQEKNANVYKQNSDLTSALFLCQSELAFVTDKLIVSETVNETVKKRANALVSYLSSINDEFCKIDAPEDKLSAAELFGCVKTKVEELLQAQKDGDKTLHEQDLKRFDVSKNGDGDGDQGDTKSGHQDDEDQEHHHEGEDEDDHAANRARSHINLLTELTNLNKILQQKEQIMSSINISEDKYQEMKPKYEASIKKMEDEISLLRKEKESLMQQLKSEPSTKLSEQRRKRIQDLEQNMQDLRKKVVEQERVIKANEKNSVKLKNLSEEILNMKKAKVKLINQMKVDANNYRVWKQKRDKEVIQLKQAEQKQKCQLARMENRFAKQQNVLKMTIEEAQAAKKRLKEVFEKQRLVRSASGHSSNKLGGSAERVRNCITQELDMVISVKEASRAHGQLVEGRRLLTKEMDSLKKQSRQTMTPEQLRHINLRVKQLQDDLDLRNAQIADLQKQIVTAESSKDNAADSGVFWWDTDIKTMTDARIAIAYLFNKMVDTILDESKHLEKVQELEALYNEAIKNTDNLEEEICTLKKDHNDELLKNAQDFSEQIRLLLSQLDQNEIRLKESEWARLESIKGAIDHFHELTEEPAKPAKRVTKKKRSMEEEEEEDTDTNEPMEMNDESDFEDDHSQDPDWKHTPLFRRVRKMRNVTNVSTLPAFEEESSHHDESQAKAVLKRKTRSGNEENLEGMAKVKRLGGCSCKTQCSSKRCACKKAQQTCDTSKCKCTDCKNKVSSGPSPDDEADESGRSILSEVDMSKNSSARTASLLNETFDVSPVHRTPSPQFNLPNLDFSTRRVKPVFQSPLQPL